MKKYKGFTLTELMVAIAVLGILAAIVLPALLRNNPNQSKMMMKKAFYTTSNVVSEMVNNTRMYPLGTCNGEDCKGIDNEENVTIDGKTYGGHSKFGELLPTMLNVDGSVSDCTSTFDSCKTFRSQDGMTWQVLYDDGTTDNVTIGSRDVVTGEGEEQTITTEEEKVHVNNFILVDVNGSKAPNCYQGSTEDNCSTRTKNFDQFRMFIQDDGKIVVDAGEAWAKEAITVNSDINAD